VRLRPWQKRELRKIYDNPAGTRMAIISFAKKNGKTSFAAFLLLLHLCGPEHRPNTQLPSTAQSKDQAAILFNLAAKVVRLSPTLSPVITIRDTIKQLACEELGRSTRRCRPRMRKRYFASRGTYCSSLDGSSGAAKR
jgi:phage terminase large subunit-like protein